jgi:prevent-host-death family protein
MQTFTANEAKTRFGEFLDRVQREPVRVMRHDRVVGVMVSAEDYEAMRAFYADRLLKTMNETAEAAERAGLTPEKLDELLADESLSPCESSRARRGHRYQCLDQRLADQGGLPRAVDAAGGSARSVGFFCGYFRGTERTPVAPQV